MFGFIKDFFRNLKFSRDSKPFIFLVCLMLATLLWLIKTMDKPYETTVAIPVQYTNLPRNKILVNPPDSKLDVKLRATGLTLLRHKIGLTITPINFNVRLFTDNLMEKSNSSRFFILTNRYIPQISSQVGAGITIQDIFPDTLFFEFENLKTRKVKIAPNFMISCQNQYLLSDSILFSPGYIEITGPSSMVDTIREINTLPYKFRDVNATIKRNVKLEKINQIEYSDDRVNVEIPVSQYTEYTEKINLVKFHVPDSLNLITFPGRIDVSCMVSLSQFKNISSSSFIIGVDYRDINKHSNLLPVKVLGQPGNIKSLKVQPAQVEYVIEKK